MDWRDIPATKEFFKALYGEFNFDNYWYTTTDDKIIWRYRGQRDVFEAIKRILGERPEE
jgi:hypothetical protein